MAQQRSGKTVKVSVSLDEDDLAALKRRAKDAFDGNLSAAFAEAARWLRQQEARRGLLEMLGGETLTDASRAALDAEQAGGPRHEPTRGEPKPGEPKRGEPKPGEPKRGRAKRAA